MGFMRFREMFKNVYSFGCKYRMMRKFYHTDYKNGMATRKPHHVFLEYFESTKSNNSNEIISTLNKINYNYENFDYCQNLDKNSIRSILERNSHLELKQSINDIDDRCVSIISQLTITEIFEYLIFLLKINEALVSHTKFYAESIKILKIALKRNQLNRQQILIFLYFAGLNKKFRTYNVKYIAKYLPPIKTLSLIEQSIVAHTLYKSSIKFNKIQANFIEKTIEKNSVLLVKESYLLVPLCKALRYVGPSKKFTMNNLSQALINVQSKFELPFIAHVMSLYAETYLKQNDVLKKFSDDAFAYMTKHKDVRLKDVDRFLWSARILNYSFEENEIKIINMFIDKKFKQLEVENNLLMNILLSLWIFEYKSVERIKKCFEKKIFLPIIENKTLWKPIARLHLLLSCIKIEAPEIEIPDELYISHKVGLTINKNIRNIFKTLNILKDDLGINELELNCPVDGIYIPGISLKHNEFTNVHIDLLDESTCLRNSIEPHGLMNLKLRLLPKIGYQTILVTEEYIKTSRILHEYLNKILNK